MNLTMFTPLEIRQGQLGRSERIVSMVRQALDDLPQSKVADLILFFAEHE